MRRLFFSYAGSGSIHVEPEVALQIELPSIHGVCESVQPEASRFRSWLLSRCFRSLIARVKEPFFTFHLVRAVKAGKSAQFELVRQDAPGLLEKGEGSLVPSPDPSLTGPAASRNVFSATRLRTPSPHRDGDSQPLICLAHPLWLTL